jgi:hypothetical protein
MTALRRRAVRWGFGIAAGFLARRAVMTIRRRNRLVPAPAARRH